MTELLSGAAPSLPRDSFFLHTLDSAANDWQQRYYSQMPMLTSTWNSGHTPQMGGMQDVDLRMFQYQNDYATTAPQFLNPAIGFSGDGSWTPDVDMGTPSTPAFQSELSESYHAAANNHLRPPQRPEMRTGSPQSQGSSQSGLSPHHRRTATTSAQVDPRPSLTRSITAPEYARRPTTSGDVPVLKRSNSDEVDEEYLPVEDAKLRGRKRQRIPHTAVERRYRENLNAHLDKLRQAVPTLASRRQTGKHGESVQEGVKPSKCEILNGAIEHIGALDKENTGLKQEVRMLRAELEKWYRSSGGAKFGT